MMRLRLWEFRAFRAPRLWRFALQSKYLYFNDTLFSRKTDFFSRNWTKKMNFSYVIGKYTKNATMEMDDLNDFTQLFTCVYRRQKGCRIISIQYMHHNQNVVRSVWSWTSAAGDRGPSWIFMHGTDKVEKGLMVLFFVLLFPLPFPWKFFRFPGNFSVDALVCGLSKFCLKLKLQAYYLTIVIFVFD